MSDISHLYPMRADLSDEIERLRAINAELDKGAEAVIAERDRLRAINAELVAALQRIDGINDNPACFNVEINEVVMAAIAKAKP